MRFIIMILMAMLMFSCASSRFYIKTGSRLGKCRVYECRIVSFQDVDSSKVVKRKMCRTVPMTASQRHWWFKNTDVEIDYSKTEIEDE